MNIYEEMINRNQFKMQKPYYGINSNGHLIFSGVDTIELASRFGTPLFVFSENRIRENYKNMRSAFKRYCNDIKISFAYKSNSLLSIIKIFAEEGAYADVVSEGEYYKAQKVGVDLKKIIFNGNNKSKEGIKMGIANGSIINVDSLNELDLLIEEAKKIGEVANIFIRVNPNISTDIIEEFSTGIRKSKFGIDIDNGDALQAFKTAIDSKCCNVMGAHIHIGSQVDKSKYYKQSTKRIMDFYGELKRELSLDLEYINLGGGFAIPFEYLDECASIEDFAKTITTAINEKIIEHELIEPTIIIEPGGSLIGNTAVTLMKVGIIKQKKDRYLAALDGGADILLRATQGWYTYRAECANKMHLNKTKLYDLVGPLCYEGDIVAGERYLPNLSQDDIVVFIDTGAYTIPLMNHYNCRLLPAIVMIQGDGEIKLIRKRDEYKDLHYNEIL